MTARFAENLAAGASANQGSHRAMVVKSMAGKAAFATGKLFNRDRQKVLNGHDLVHHPGFQSAFRRHGFACEDDIERLGQTNQPRFGSGIAACQLLRLIRDNAQDIPQTESSRPDSSHQTLVGKAGLLGGPALLMRMPRCGY
jgi:hypothetical protein